MEISEIKSQLTLAKLISHYGLKADKQNRLRCPSITTAHPAYNSITKHKAVTALAPTAKVYT